MDEDKVKWPSKRKYPCKRNKGEHEWGKPEIKHEIRVSYAYKETLYGTKGVMTTRQFHPELELIEAEVSLTLETRCLHCEKKVLSFLRDKIK